MLREWAAEDTGWTLSSPCRWSCSRSRPAPAPLSLPLRLLLSPCPSSPLARAPALALALALPLLSLSLSSCSPRSCSCSCSCSGSRSRPVRLPGTTARYNTVCGSIRKIVAELAKLDDQLEAKRLMSEKLVQKLYARRSTHALSFPGRPAHHSRPLPPPLFSPAFADT